MKDELNLEIEIKKKHAQLITAVLFIIFGVMVVTAITSPNPGHIGNNIWIRTLQGGFPTEKTLQQTLDSDVLYASQSSPDFELRGLLGPRSRLHIAYVSACYRSCKAGEPGDPYGWCASPPHHFNMGAHQACAISIFGNEDGIYGIEEVIYNSATKEWDMYAQNSIIMFTCLDRAVDFPGPPAYNCIFDGE